MSVAALSLDGGASGLESSLGMGIVTSVLRTLGLPPIVVDRLVDAATTARTQAEGALDRQADDALLDALSVGYALQGQLEATAVEITRALSRRVAERLLGERGFTSPDELSARARKSWRRDTKLAVAAELQALLGLGVQESYDMIALANAPVSVREPVTQGMSERGLRWGQARKFWDEAGDLDHEDAADVAQALFGNDPDRVVRERLEQVEADLDDKGADGEAGGEADNTGQSGQERPSPEQGDAEQDGHGPTSQSATRVKDSPWPTRTFARELKREVAARRKEADRHRQARRSCGMSVSIGADGISSITFTGETVRVTGMAQRVEDVARRVRREGAESNLDDLRFRTGAILLMHSSLPELGINSAPGAADGSLLDPGELLSVADLERIAGVLAAQPAVELQIITPLDAIIGTESLDFLRERCSGTTACGHPPSGATSESVPGHGSSGRVRSGPEPVGEVLGPQSAFVTAEQLRELLLQPRSVLRRLVTDPVTGFLLHRESSAYRPDAALRAFVRARDVMCKGVGCTHPAFYADLDHVIRYPDGPTSAANLNLACRREHLVKTYGLTKCAMDETGTVQWTTFFGRIYTSEPHDYLQYSPLPAITPPSHAEPSSPSAQDPSLPTEGSGNPSQNVRDLIRAGHFFRGMERDEAERLAGRLIYAALAHRPARSRLRASDDGPWDDTVPEHPHAWLATVPIRLRHTTPGGQPRNGPPPDQPTPEEILVEEGLARPVDPEHGSAGDRDPWQDIPPF